MNDGASLSAFRAGRNEIELARLAITEVNQRTPVDDTALAAFLADPACYLILATEAGRVVGSLSGYALRHPHRHEPQLLLYEIDVRAECRGRGIGRALVAAFTAEARAAGAFEQWVLTNESNAAAMAMYQANGYQRPNRDDVMMKMDL